MGSRDQAVFVIGTLPFLLILGAFITMGVFFFFVQLTASDITEILLAMGTIWLIVMLVLIFVTQVCMSISPRERFVDKETPLQAFLDSFAKTEATVCTMVDAVVKFIESDVGQKGQDDPSLNQKAINDALSNVDGPITTCPPPSSVNDYNDRLSRMQRTLDQFIKPELKKTYDKVFDQKGCDNFVGSMVPIEPFDNPESEFIMMVAQLQIIQSTIVSLTNQYLAPIQQKQKELQSGKASDCDKKKGAHSSVGSSLSMIRGSSKPGV